MAVGGRGGATDRGWGPRVFLLRYRHARSRLRAGNRTPEPGGLTTLEAQRLIRELGGLDFVGADLVEVSPPLDTSGVTGICAVAILFGLPCAWNRRPACPAVSAEIGPHGRECCAGRP